MLFYKDACKLQLGEILDDAIRILCHNRHFSSSFLDSAVP